MHKKENNRKQRNSLNASYDRQFPVSMGLAVAALLWLLAHGRPGGTEIALILGLCTFGIFDIGLIFMNFCMPSGRRYLKGAWNGKFEELVYELCEVGFSLERKVGDQYIFSTRHMLPGSPDIIVSEKKESCSVLIPTRYVKLLAGHWCFGALGNESVINNYNSAKHGEKN